MSTRSALLLTGGGLLGLAGVGLAGLLIRPKSAKPALKGAHAPDTLPIPEGLPAPLSRFLMNAYGQRVPVVETAVVWGRARMRLGPLKLWLRYTEYFKAGQAFVRKMEGTWFGLPVIRATDTCLEGRGEMRLRMGKEVVSCGSSIDQGALINLFGEAVFTPAVWITDKRICWEATSDLTARMHIAAGWGEETLDVQFDPSSGFPTEIRAMRFKTAEGTRTEWRAKLEKWRFLNGLCIPTLLTVQWADERHPWSVWEVLGIEPNVAVDEVLRPSPLDENAAVELRTSLAK